MSNIQSLRVYHVAFLLPNSFYKDNGNKKEVEVSGAHNEE